MQIIYNLFIFPLSFLPLRFLHILGGGVYFILYYVIRYRKKVIASNLRNSFPQIGETEIQKTIREFYHRFSEIIMEMVKMLTISRKEVNHRISFINTELINRYFEEGRNVVAVVGHFGNWELGGYGLNQVCRHKILAVYKSMSSGFFDRLIYRFRSRFGTIPVEMGMIARQLMKPENEPWMSVFIADQSPLLVEHSEWVNFLGQKSAVYSGSAKIAVRFNAPVVFCRMQRLRRGYYCVEFIQLHENPARTTVSEITRLHTELLEKIIREDPAGWLWTHKRWKRKQPSTT